MTVRLENILIFGATGYIGAYILEKIIEAKASFGRIAIFTSSSTAENKPEGLGELKKKGVEVIIGDVTKSEDILNAYKGLKYSIEPELKGQSLTRN